MAVKSTSEKPVVSADIAKAVSQARTTAERMGLERFLQLYPMKSAFQRIMRSRYAAEVHTYDEWVEIYEKTINRKVTS